VAEIDFWDSDERRAHPIHNQQRRKATPQGRFIAGIRHESRQQPYPETLITKLATALGGT